MLRWISLILVILIVTVGVIEYVFHVTPLEQIASLVSWAKSRGSGDEVKPDVVIRLGIASWQMAEFPWEETIRRYEEAHGGKIKIRASTIPEDSLNSVLLFWASGYTEYDAIVAWADEEIHPFIDYNWNTKIPERRSVIVNVADWLTPEQVEAFVPALFGGCSRKDPVTGRMNLYELPWMGEVLALNYNKKFFAARGVTKVPETWEEVEQACAKIKGLEHNGSPVAPISMNFAQEGFFAQNSYIPMLAAFKKGRGIADEKGRLDVSSPEAARVFETLKSWYDAGYITPHCMVSSDVEADLRVMRSAMYAHWQSRGLWAVADQGADTIGIAPTPGSKEAGSLVATYGCIIPKCSPHIRQTVDFCYEAFCTDTYGFQSAVAKGWFDPRGNKTRGGGKMPATKAMYDRTDLPPGIAELGRTLDRGYSYPDPANWAHCAEILVVEFQKYLSGNTRTAEEALAIVQRRFAEEVYAEK
jgi:ABC-type glycerol-3-phosphate transport system substrate-binding protein